MRIYTHTDPKTNKVENVIFHGVHSVKWPDPNASPGVVWVDVICAVVSSNGGVLRTVPLEEVRAYQ